MFVLYILALIYFLFFADRYGQMAFAQREYHYNLVLFTEIRRFWNYREQLGFLAVAGQSSGKCCRIYAFWYDPSADLQKCKRIFLHHFLWIYTEPVCGSDPAYDKTGKL